MRSWREKDAGEKKRLLCQIWIGLFCRVGLFILTMGCLFTFVFGIRKAEGNHMYPAVQDGDVLMLYRLGDYIRWDVVEYQVNGTSYLGRIVGTAGTAVGATDDGRLTLDGRFQPVQPRKGIYEETLIREKNDSKANSTHSAQVLEKDSYYILGDRRSEAVDSRQLGAIQRDQIRGKVFMLWRRRSL